MSFISSYTPQRLAIWRGYSNFGFPVSQQVATRNFGFVTPSYVIRYFSNNRMFALGGTAQADVQVSADGVSFSSVALPVSQVWRDICGNGSGTVIAVGGTNSTDIAISSNNGVSFNASTVFAPADWSGLAFGAGVGGANGRWLAVQNASTTYYTSDNNGVSWTLRVAPNSTLHANYLNGLFYAWNGSSLLWSADAITWASATVVGGGVPSGANKNSMAFGVVSTIGITVITNGTSVWWSLDGKTFTSSRFPTTFSCAGVSFDGQQFVFADAAATNIIYSSPDAKWFTQRMQVDTLACSAIIPGFGGKPFMQVTTGSIRVEDATAYEVSYV